MYLTTSKHEPTKEKYLSPYVAALAIIASETSKYDDERHIEIQIYSGASSIKKPAKAYVDLSPNGAKEILQNLYHKSFCEKYSKAVPADILDKKIEKFSDYTNMVSNAWSYFEKAKVFDKRKDLGFSPNINFSNEWKVAVEQQNGLITFSIVGKEGEK